MQYPLILIGELKSKLSGVNVDHDLCLCVAVNLGQLFMVFAVLSKCNDIEYGARSDCNARALSILKIDYLITEGAMEMQTEIDVKFAFYTTILDHIIENFLNDGTYHDFFCAITISIGIPLICCWTEGSILIKDGFDKLIFKCLNIVQSYTHRQSQHSKKTEVTLSLVLSLHRSITRSQIQSDSSRGYVLVTFLADLCKETLIASQDSCFDKEKLGVMVDALLDLTSSVKRFVKRTSTYFLIIEMRRCMDYCLVQEMKSRKTTISYFDCRVIMLYLLHPTLDSVLNVNYTSSVTKSSSKAANLLFRINESMKRALGRDMVTLEKLSGTVDRCSSQNILSYLPYCFVWVAIANAKNDFGIRAIIQTILQTTHPQLASIRSSANAAWAVGLTLPYGSSLKCLKVSGSLTETLSNFLEMALSTETSSPVIQAIIDMSQSMNPLCVLFNKHLEDFRNFMLKEEAWRFEATDACDSLARELSSFS